jgi:hypothetical protein
MADNWLAEEAHEHCEYEPLLPDHEGYYDTVLRNVAEAVGSRGGIITALDLRIPLGVGGYRAKAIAKLIPFEPTSREVAETATCLVYLTRKRRRHGPALIKRVDVRRALGNDAPMAPLHHATIKAAAKQVARILASEPELGSFGFGVYDASNKPPQQRAEELQRDRAAILDEYHIHQFIVAREWLSQFPKTKAPNKTGTSYDLKHVPEDEIGYVSNGAFIAAAIAAGFTVRRIGDSPNAWLNISTVAWRQPEHGGPPDAAWLARAMGLE